MLYDTRFSEKQDNRIKCFLCPHHCVIGADKFGLCSVRTNKHGVLKTINYGEITAMALDPIEKKPFYHFKPGKNILSVGSFGCNFSCEFCQNYAIAHLKTDSEYVSVDALIQHCVSIEGNTGIAFTYNEPSIWYEYVYDTAKKLKQKYPYLNIAIVTNGYIEAEPLLKLLPYVDAMNIDLKSFNEDYYKKTCGGDLKSVLKTIEHAYDKCHVEITTLMVRGLNDSKEEIEKIAFYLAKLNKSIPLHLTRYFPMYKMTQPPTEIKMMLEAKKHAQKQLNYVYLGNVACVDDSTYCPDCGKLMIERNDSFTKAFICEPICPACGVGVKITL